MKRFALLLVSLLMSVSTIYASTQRRYYRVTAQDKIRYKSVEEIIIIDLDTFRNAIKFNRGDSILELATPPVGDQGTQGSCAAWALGYCCSSIQAYNKYQDWNWATRSPAFAFNYAVIERGSSCLYIEPYKVGYIIYKHGICSYDLMPYDESDCSTEPNSIQKADAQLNKGEYKRFKSASDVNEYKKLLRMGYPIAVSTQYVEDLEAMWHSDGVWTNITRTNDVGHMTTIIGYNDNTQMFKVQNSWGTSGGDNGYYWVTYDLVRRGCYDEAYILQPMSNSYLPRIEGPEFYCDSLTAIYTVRGIPHPATINWNMTNLCSSDLFKCVIATGQGTDSVRVAVRQSQIFNPPIVMSSNPSDDISGLSAKSLTVDPYHGKLGVSVDVGDVSKSTSTYVKASTVGIPLIFAPKTPWYVNVSRTFMADISMGTNLQWRVYRNDVLKQTTNGKNMTYIPKSTGEYKICLYNLDDECPEHHTELAFDVTRQVSSISKHVTNGILKIEFNVAPEKLDVIDKYYDNPLVGSENNHKYEVMIMDAFGIMVAQTKTELQSCSFDVSKLAYGLYVIVVRKGETIIYTDKLLIN